MTKDLEPVWRVPLPRVKDVRSLEVERDKHILVSEIFKIVSIGKIHLPLLHDEEGLLHFPSVTVDPGAVKFICNGADVMRPGIVSFDLDFGPNQVVVVKEQTYKKYIAAGVSLLGRSEAESVRKGPIVKNWHYVGDKVWEAYKEVKDKMLRM